VDGQACIDSLVAQYRQNELDAGHRVAIPATTRQSDGDSSNDDKSGQLGGIYPGNDAADQLVDVTVPDASDYDGPSMANLRETCPDNRSLGYHAIIRAFCNGHACVRNWKLEGAAAANGYADGLSIDQIVADLRGEYLDSESVGFDRKTRGRIETDYERTREGALTPHSWKRLAAWQVLPPHVALDGANDGGEYEYTSGYTTILPHSPKMDAIRAGWNYHADTRAEAGGSPAITKTDVHDRVENHVRTAIQHGDRALIDSLMTTGKTYSALKVAGELDEQVFYCAGTTRLREEVGGHCSDLGLTHVALPESSQCPVFDGSLGTAGLTERVRRLRDEQGLTPSEIHERLDLPCDHAHEGGCPYRQQWAVVEEAGDDVDVLIGDYGHAQLDHLCMGRVVVVDENPSDRYTTQFWGTRLERTVNAFCDRHPEFPCSDYTDVLQARASDDRRAEARTWFDQYPFDRDPGPCVEHPDYHAYAPHATAAVLFAESVHPHDPTYPNKTVTLSDADRTRAQFIQGRDRDTSAVELLTPPDFPHATALLALDGTPGHQQWERSLGTTLTHREPLASDDEKRSYVRDTLGIEGIDLSGGAVRTHSSGIYVNVERASAALHALADEYDHQPAVFDTKKAIRQYDDAGVADDDGPANALDNFANLRGTNDYADTRTAYIAGSPHYGDGWVRKQAAWEGHAVARNDEKGMDLSYATVSGTPVGDDFLWQMREAEVAQAALRVGRNGQGALVAFGTAAYPDWFPIGGHGDVLRTWTDHQRDIITALADLAPHATPGDGITTRDILDHPSVTCGLRWVEKGVAQLEQLGYISRDPDHSGRGFAYLGDGLHRMNADGQVELPTVALPEDSPTATASATGGTVSEAEVGERTHNTYYTASFAQTPASTAGPRGRRGEISLTIDFYGVRALISDAADDNPPPD
jgi:hypothetical protein